MKKLLFCLSLLIGTYTATKAQVGEDPGQFMAKVKKMMDGSRNPQYIASAAALDSVWNTGMSAQQQGKLMQIVQTQVSRGQKAGMVMYLLMGNVVSLVQRNPSALDGFLDMTAKVGTVIDGKGLQNIFQTSLTLTNEGKLYSSNRNQLYLLSGSYRFKVDSTQKEVANNLAAQQAADDSWDTPIDTNYVIAPQSTPLPVATGPLLELEDAIFAMVTSGDSVVFGPSTGKLALKEGIFVGEKGAFSWATAGDSSISVALDRFSFNIANPKLVADNVTMRNEAKLLAPIKGKLEYRGIRKVRNQPAQYPRFISNGTDARLKFGSPGLQYKGGFALIGQDMYGTALSGEPSVLRVSFKEKPAFQAISSKFQLMDSVFRAPLAAVAMYMGPDSLFHPGVTFKYNDVEGQLRLGRADKTDFGSLPYKDSYHKMDIWSQALRWDLPKETIEFYRINGKDVVPVTLESWDFFKKERFAAIGKEFGFQPLLMAANYTQTMKTSAFLAEELAAKFKQNPKIMRRTLERLYLDGYFLYNKNTDQYALSKKGVLFILANMEKTDYDNFQISSQFVSTNELANASIYLPDTLLTVRGVSRFVISDSLNIYAVPADKKVVIGRNRNFSINGQLVSANYQFRGQGLKFDYNQFFVDVTPKDSITFTPREKYVKGQKSEVGAHVKYENGGTFYLSDPKNKSGKQKGKGTPRIVVPDGMIVYFDQPERGELLYPKEVFFKIPKIDMDGLDQRDVIFDGTFNSDGILPPIKTILKSMPDNSLGFEYKMPAQEVKIYGGKALARFTDTLKLDNGGLQSKAVLKYLAAQMPADRVVLGADSVFASGSNASIKEGVIGKAYFPEVAIKDYAMHWFPKSDSMYISTRGQSFSLFKGSTSLEGSLLLRTSGLYGTGVLKRSDSEITSEDIKFNKEGFLANRSIFSINSVGDKAGKKLLTGNNVNIDFNSKNGIAQFVTDKSGFDSDSSGMGIPTASYQTLIGSATWDMNKKNILIKGFGETSTYTSTLPDQEGLAFEGSEALYDIDKVSLNIKGVPYIKTADVKIIPDQGLVSIDEKGRISPLKNARIEIDTLNTAHRLRDANIRIDSRNHFEGSATYQYITARKDTFNIKMQDFELRELELGDDKKGRQNLKTSGPARYYTTARADIKESENLLLSPRIQYKGNINLVAYEPSLKLDGYVKPVLKFRKDFQSSWILFQEEPGESITIPINKELKNEHEIPLSVGLHYNERRGMYMTFLSPKESDADEDVYLANGGLFYDEEANGFKVMPPPGADGLIDEGKALWFDDETGEASFSGPLQLISAPWLQATGKVTAQVDSSKFAFNTLLMLKMTALEPLLQPLGAKIVEVNLEEQNSTAADDDPDQLRQKLSALIGAKATSDFEKLSAAGYKPLYDASPALIEPMVLSNVNLHWSAAHQAYFSQGPIGVSHFGKNNINAQMEGMLEIRKGIEGDEFSLYLEASPDVWYYFDYRFEELGVVSSVMDFNDRMMSVKGGKSKMALLSVGIDEKEAFVRKFDDYYQPALKKARLVKAAKKKVDAPTPAAKKKKVEQAEGF
ncbi:hypothetical protein CLV98_10118 [Dyadobacter jejuensis]|uniref:Uncharacterized protein n=1 Tax=Dyadobacter jejuensis TaxID=1082580 RepID=A0A316ARI7_9BACT|nr:hypothetical protein [Dyadobacter jejuensis]PWJ59844.1 hypothetical protein CLV98_10118 [Dyadobacter jejuensis]